MRATFRRMGAWSSMMRIFFAMGGWWLFSRKAPSD
jgi:hypothetical protein